MYSPFFCNDAPPAAIYTLSLHDALPIYPGGAGGFRCVAEPEPGRSVREAVHSRTEKAGGQDRKSTRLNSSHVKISYAVFCLKKKKRRPGSDCAEEATSQSDMGTL